jgi:LPS export ABC transporter protein LptC
MTAPREEQMENGDMIYPKGVYIEFFNEKQVRNTTLRANSGVYYKEQNLYTVTGNVVIVDSVKIQKMNTEELHWTPKTQKIFTDKFVVIQTKSDTLKGQGLEANQDFSRWKILKPTGTLPLSQQ